jgi:ABC-type multidrug transport system permease subunit
MNQGPAGAGRAASLVQQAHEVIPPKRGNPWKQFRLLSQRYIELLWNDKGNLLILLLQAPIIAVILFFLAADNTFASSTVVTCPAATYQAAGIPRTVLVRGHNDDCQNPLNFLTNGSPQAQAFIQSHPNKDTGVTSVDEALQYFIAPGSGGNAQKILFIMAFAAVMFGCINGAREIVKEEAVYRRERAVYLGITPYLFSKIVVLGFLCLIQSLVLVLIVNGKASFSDKGIFLPTIVEIYISMFFTAMAGLMMGLTVSALAPNNDRATSMIPILLIPQVIFSGIIFQLDSPPMQFLGAFFAARWAMAGMGSTIGLHSLFVTSSKGDTSGESFSYQGTLFSTTDKTHATLHLLLCWGALLVMSVVLALATAYFLRRKDVRKS